jgi:oligopeptidase B
MNRRKMMTSAAAVITSVSVIPPENALSESMMSESPPPVPPVAQKIPKRTEQLGRVRVDDYAWMKDDNWQKVLRDPTLIKAEVKDHLTAENA